MHNPDTQNTEKNSDDKHEFDAVTAIVSALRPMSEEARRRILDTVTTFLNLGAKSSRVQESMAYVGQSADAGTGGFSADRSLTPKEFLFTKKPQTDIERVACLAYYLAHYRSTQFFKTLDLSQLNTEAAQIKFSNAAVAVDNACKAGFLVAASKGQKQLSAHGEIYVQSLPDREAARQAISERRPRRKKRSKQNPVNQDNDAE